MLYITMQNDIAISLTAAAIGHFLSVRLENAYLGPFWKVLGILSYPQKGNDINETPKTCPWERRHMRIDGQNRTVRHVDEMKKQKRHGKKPDSDKLAVRPDHPRCRSAIWICVRRHIREVVIYSKLHRNLFSNFGDSGYRNVLSLSLTWPLVHATACTTVQAVINKQYLDRNDSCNYLQK